MQKSKLNKFLTYVGSLCASIHTSAQESPNIIVFLVDDMGLMDTSVPFITNENGEMIRQPLNEWYHTPGMERLAKQGIRFSAFYANNVSSPSRASLMTGQSAARHRITNWINAESNNRSLFGPPEWNWKGLTSKDMTYPSILKAAGYKTIHIGKAHFGCKNSEGENPLNLGFDINIGGSAIGHPGSYHGENGYGKIKGNKSRAVPDLEQYHGTDVFLSDALTIEACKEIKKAVDVKQPFYLNMSHYAVHAPFETDERFIGRYTDPTKSAQANAFATLIEGMDKSLSDLMDKLDEFGVAENTIIFFLGDNGGDAPLGIPTGYGSAAPLRGKKGYEYEGGTRVPFIVSWAQVNPKNKFQQMYPIDSGKIQSQIATIMDIYPSVLSVARVGLPKGHIIDGNDLKKMVAGEKDKKHRDDFMMHYPHDAGRGKYFTSYRKGDWKLIYYYHPEANGKSSCELYNLKEDPYEMAEVAKENPKIVKRMFKLMKERLEKEKALYPINRKKENIYPILSLIHI